MLFKIDDSFLIKNPVSNFTLKTGKNGIFVDTISGSSSVTLSIVFPGINLGDPQYPVLNLLHNIIGSSSLTSRINSVLREREGLTYGGGSGFACYNGAGHQAFVIPVEPHNVSRALPQLIDLVSKVRLEGITQEELSKEKEKIKSGQVLLFESISNLSQILLSKIIRERATGQPMLSFEENIAQSEAVTLDQVNELASTLLKPEYMQVFAVGNTTYENISRILGY